MDATTTAVYTTTTGAPDPFDVADQHRAQDFYAEVARLVRNTYGTEVVDAENPVYEEGYALLRVVYTVTRDFYDTYAGVHRKAGSTVRFTEDTNPWDDEVVYRDDYDALDW